MQRQAWSDGLGAMSTLAWTCLPQGLGTTACSRKREHGTHHSTPDETLSVFRLRSPRSPAPRRTRRGLRLKHRSAFIRAGMCCLAFAAAGFAGAILLRPSLRPEAAFRAPVAPLKEELRAEPIRIEPVVDSGAAASREQAVEVLQHLVPRWRNYKNSAQILHALRLWSAVERWGPEALTQAPFVQAVLDQQRNTWVPFFLSSELYLEKSTHWLPLLFKTPHGVGVRLGDDPAQGAFCHPDQFLQVLGEIGISANTPIQLTGGQTAQVRDLICDAIARFGLEQELEFTAVALALWLPPRDRWTNRFGARFDFEDLAKALLARPREGPTCFGTHIPYALIHLLRASDSYPILKESTRRRIRARLQETVAALKRDQQPNGAWTPRWTGTRLKNQGRTPPSLQAFQVTCHHLEWMAFAPPDLRPQPKDLERAVNFVCEFVAWCSPSTVRGTYSPFSHGARAVLLHSLPAWGEGPSTAARGDRLSLP